MAAVTVLDFKRDFRSLVLFVPGIAVLRWHNIGYNLLELRLGISVLALINRVVSVMCNAFHLLQGSNSFLTRELGIFLRQWGHDRLMDHPPTIFEFGDWIKQRLIERRYLGDDRILAARAVRTIEGIREGTGRVFDVRKGIDVALLREMNSIIELDGMNPSHAELLAAAMLCEIYQLNLAEGRRYSTCRHVTICDEAQNLFPIDRERVPEEGVPLLFRLFVMAREVGGCGHILASQNPSKISQMVRSNLGTQFCFSLSDGDELATVQKGMMLFD